MFVPGAAPAGEQAPDLWGAINVSGDRVYGIDITLAVYNSTETCYLADVLITGETSEAQELAVDVRGDRGG